MMLLLRHISNLSSSGYWFEKAMIRELRRFLNDNTGGTILDFGCGQKPFGYLFKGYRGRYLGVDVYPGEKVDIVYDGEEIPLADESVDLVFSSSVLEHVRDIERSLREINRILVPGGRMLAVVPFINHIHGVPFDYHRYTSFGWGALLEKTFGASVRYQVQPVDSRLNCIINMITSQVNYMFYDLLRVFARLCGIGNMKEKNLHAGDASPESHNTGGMKLAYFFVQLNPVNFLFGLLSWLLSQIPLQRRPEGEITSGYLIKVTKPW